MPDKNSLEVLASKLRAYAPDVNQFPHDVWVVAALEEALQAAEEGNFGVGAALLNEQGAIVIKGHNQVFSPYFRSDAHAEMVVVSAFEDSHRNTDRVGGYMLVTSLEPCPMCFARLLTSGIGRIYYACEDKEAGMVTRLNDLPPVWRYLAEGKQFGPALCSPALRDLAFQTFLTTGENDRQLKLRASNT